MRTGYESTQVFEKDQGDGNPKGIRRKPGITPLKPRLERRASSLGRRWHLPCDHWTRHPRKDYNVSSRKGVDLDTRVNGEKGNQANQSENATRAQNLVSRIWLSRKSTGKTPKYLCNRAKRLEVRLTSPQKGLPQSLRRGKRRGGSLLLEMPQDTAGVEISGRGGRRTGKTENHGISLVTEKRTSNSEDSQHKPQKSGDSQ